MLNTLSRSVGENLQHTTEKFFDNIAIKDSRGAYTYRELMQVSDQICLTLHRRGLKRGDVVALCFDQSKEAIAATLGVLKAGCCFTPMDVSDPVARLQFINQDCTPAALLIGESNEDLAKQVADHQQVIINFGQLEYADIDRMATQSVSPESLAYIFYTSGSTGKPKGVCQSHRNLLHFANVYGKTLRLHNRDILSMLYSLNFSASNMDIFSGLMNGATVNLYNLKEKGIDGLSKWLDTERVTILHTIPTVLRYLVNDSPEHHMFTHIRAIDLGGEPVYSSDIDKFQRCFSQQCRIFNHFAATEASVIAQHEIDFEYKYKAGILPVGKPAQGVQVTVTEENGEPAATNEVGQITIFSPFLSPGYWNRPELTEKGFIEANEKIPVRGYHSGDFGFLDENGNLNYLGRSDCRVKIRGYRIECGEIETRLIAHPAVQEAVVLPQEDEWHNTRLVAYLVPRKGSALHPSDLREFLSRSLPAYMIPASIVSLKAFPLTPNGKVDRVNLSLAACQASTEDHPYVAPRNTLEKQLIQIWETVFSTHPIGVTENFYHLGGESLLAIRLCAAMERVLHKKIPVTVIFHAQTIEQLALIISEGKKEPPSSHMVPIQSGGAHPPIFCVLFGSNFKRYLHTYPEQPLYMFFNQGHDGRPARYCTVEEIAACYLKDMRTVQPKGPYFLAGYSFGGLVVHEMAQQLRKQGEAVGLLALVDPRPSRLQPAPSPPGTPLPRVGRTPTPGGTEQSPHFTTFAPGLFSKALEAVQWRAQRIRNTTWIKIKAMLCHVCFRLGYPLPTSLRRFYSFRVVLQASKHYLPQIYPGPIVIFQTDHFVETCWRNLCTEVEQVYDLPCKHLDIHLDGPHAPTLLQQLMHHLEKSKTFLNKTRGRL